MALNNTDCNLVQIEFEGAQNEADTNIQFKKKRGTYVVYATKERFEIGKHVVEIGTTKTVSRQISRFPLLKESIFRRFKSNYENELNIAAIQKRQPSEEICSQPRGRPTLLGSINDMAKNYIKMNIFSF